ncbi:GNAT family N-acetyltransferase [Demequina sp.]|uniref:GNAT family N-acetyltransferase n=1 Tax=Demequina sp. TaxID=2050685 RepID=UPI003D144B02
MQIDVIADGELPSGAVLEVRDLVRGAWPFLFDETDTGGLWWLAELEPVHVVATEGDRVVGYCAVIRTSVVLAHERRDILGLHGVVVRDAHRGRGCGQAIVATATKLIRESSLPAMLFCEPQLIAFYERAGWESHADSVTFVGTEASPQTVEADPTFPEVRMMLFSTQTRDTDEWREKRLYVGGSTW